MAIIAREKSSRVRSLPAVLVSPSPEDLPVVLAELQRIETGSRIDDELLDVIELIAVILGGLKGEEQNE